MCLFPKLQQNKRYTKTKKNGGNIPPVKDIRATMVPIGCGKCIECRKKKAREWQVRLLEDVKQNTNGKFITLTFSDESIAMIDKQIRPEIKGYDRDNEIAKYAVRHWLERHRKKTGKSIRHWLVTELGHKGTENIHLHGIIWTETTLEEVERLWSYGFMWKGKEVNGRRINYVNGQTVNYIIKYVTKQDEKHNGYTSAILTTPGIGANYRKTQDFNRHVFNPNGNTREYYRTATGHKIALPIYYRNAAYTDEQKEQLWLQKLDKEIRYVGGEKVDVSTEQGQQNYEQLRQWHARNQMNLGYKGTLLTWEEHQYEQQRREVMRQTRITRAKQKLKKNNNKKHHRTGAPALGV